MSIILGVKLDNRTDEASEFQNLLTKHGCSIRTRIGLHSVENGVCSPSGVILLDIIDEKDGEALALEILKIPGVKIQKMNF